MRNWVKPFAIIIISFLGAIVYSNSFNVPFIFDDNTSIVVNTSIRDIHHLQDIWNFWPCRFFTYLSIAFNYHFNGFNVFGYHLFNLAVHLITAVLVWWLTLLTLSTPAMKTEKIAQHADVIALLAGLTFVAHPVQTEAVTYIIQRAASMGALFYLVSLCFYIKGRSTSENYYYILALVLATIAMFCKEMTITLPLMILLYEFSFFKGKDGWKHLCPFMLALLIIPLTMFITRSVDFQQMRRIIEVSPGISPMHYLFTQFRVMVTYVRLAFLPLNQNFDYDYPVYKNFFDFPVFISFLFLASILYSAKCLFSKYRLISFSIFWFFLTLLPESSLFPIKDVIYEHRLYLSMAGYSLFLASSLYYLLGRRSLKVMVMVLIGIIMCYSVMSYQRNKVWSDENAFWNDAVLKSPHKARPYLGRSTSDEKQGDIDRSMADLNKAIDLDPNYSDAYYNRGLLYGKFGKLPQAVSDLIKALEISPNDPRFYTALGVVYVEEGKFTQAIFDFNKSIETDPSYVKAYVNRGVVYGQEGNFIQAISDFNKSIAIDPGCEEAYLYLGVTYGREGKLAQALLEFKKVLKINPENKEAYADLVNIQSLLHKHDTVLQ